MKKFSALISDHKFLLLAIILAAFLRFLWLDRVSPAIGGDELNYILTAKFMALRWTDISGTWNPLSIFLFHYPKTEIQAEISYFLLLPFVKFLPLSVFNAKIIFALISTFTCFVIYGVANKLFDKRIAIVAAFLFSINPWEIFLGRTAYEMGVETFFYLLSFYAILRLKGNRVYFSIPILLLAFYSHIATKIVFLPIVLCMLFYSYLQNNKKFKKQYLIIALFAILLTAFFVFSIEFNSSISRVSEVISPNSSQIIDIVDHARKSTIDNHLSYIFTNKITVFINILIIKFIKTISPEYLFATGDEFYALYTHGFFYLVDFVFILLGIISLFLKDKRKFFLLIVLSFLSIVPHLIHTSNLDNFVPQITLLFPFLILFASYGVIKIYDFFQTKAAVFLIVIIYLISFLNFSNIYFYQYPLKETFDFKVRVLSRYLSFTGENEKISIYSSNSNEYFKKYLFYRNLINDKNVDEISMILQRRNNSLGNVKFVNCNKFNIKSGVSIVDQNCKDTTKSTEYLKISRLVDGGANFKIYNDIVCKNIDLLPYPQNVKLSDFSVESLSKKEFCKTFITK